MVAAILLAAVGTWVLVTYVSNADERAEQDQELVEVLTVDAAIPAGTPVVEAARSISTNRVPRRLVADDALADLDSVRGLVTAVDLLPNEQVLASRFVDAAELAEAARSVEVPDGLLELTVQLSAERSVGGSLRPGDRVAVLSSFDPFTLDAVEPENEEDLNSFINSEDSTETITLTTPNSTGITVHKALVTRVQVGRAPEGDTAQTTADVAPSGSLLVSLAIAPGDAEQVVFTAEFGAIWLARETEGAPEEDPTLIITRANVYR